MAPGSALTLTGPGESDERKQTMALKTLNIDGR